MSTRVFTVVTQWHLACLTTTAGSDGSSCMTPVENDFDVCAWIAPCLVLKWGCEKKSWEKSSGTLYKGTRPKALEPIEEKCTTHQGPSEFFSYMELSCVISHFDLTPPPIAINTLFQTRKFGTRHHRQIFEQFCLTVFDNFLWKSLSIFVFYLQIIEHGRDGIFNQKFLS